VIPPHEAEHKRDPFDVALMKLAPKAFALLSALEHGIPVTDEDLEPALDELDAVGDAALFDTFLREYERLWRRREAMTRAQRSRARAAFVAAIDVDGLTGRSPVPTRARPRERSSSSSQRRGTPARGSPGRSGARLAAGDDDDPHDHVAAPLAEVAA
jgi:hypothetical protein